MKYFKAFIGVLLSCPFWGVVLLLQLPIYVLGWVLVPLAVLFKAYEEREGKWHFTWPFMYIWDNWEDGIAAGRQYYDAGPLWKQIIYWSCQRNPINNMRAVPIFSVKINPKKIKWVGGPYELAQQYDKPPRDVEWFFCWQFPYSNLWVQFRFLRKLLRLWVGWKLYPSDESRSDFGYRSRGADCGIRLKVIG
jgi:hypothetical protein